MVLELIILLVQPLITSLILEGREGGKGGRRKGGKILPELFDLHS